MISNSGADCKSLENFLWGEKASGKKMYDNFFKSNMNAIALKFHMPTDCKKPEHAMEIYRFGLCHMRKKTIAFYLTPIGSKVLAGTIAEVNHFDRCIHFIMFGSAAVWKRSN